jgi:hypothetical protein
MRQVIELSIAFVDLLKAELEMTKRSVFNLGIALGLVIAGIVFLTCALGLMLYAAYLVSLPALDQKLAVFITGLLALGCAGVLLWIATYKGRR